MLLDGEAEPVCCELWPGNVTDVRTLIPVVDRLRKRFVIGQVYIVADQGMTSRATIAALESETRDWQYVLGARMRRQKDVSEEVVSWAGRRYVVCLRREGKSVG